MKTNSYKIGALIAIYEIIINEKGRWNALISNSLRGPAGHIPFLDGMARNSLSYQKYKQELDDAYSEITDIPVSISHNEAIQVTLGYHHKRKELNASKGEF